MGSAETVDSLRTRLSCGYILMWPCAWLPGGDEYVIVIDSRFKARLSCHLNTHLVLNDDVRTRFQAQFTQCRRASNRLGKDDCDATILDPRNDTQAGEYTFNSLNDIAKQHVYTFASKDSLDGGDMFDSKVEYRRNPRWVRVLECCI